MGSTGTPVILYDYEFSPYGQKIKLLLQEAGVPFERVDVPPVLPREDLEKIGVTYRRIPVLAVGKDVYCDSSLQIEVIVNKLAKNKVPTSVADKAWESYGYEIFYDVLVLAPHELLTDDFVKDRETIFPILGRSDYKTLRPSGLADLQSRMDFLENTVLANGSFIGGNKLSLADIHVVWGLRWGLNDMNSNYPPGLGAEKENGVGKDKFPKVWRLLESLPAIKAETISGDDAKNKIEGAPYYAKDEGVMPKDPTGLKAGTQVAIDSLDSAPHSHPQKGKLIATATNEVVIEVENGIHVHFPREKYILREA